MIRSLFILCLGLLLLRRCLSIITVRGRSMEPVLRAGERVLLLRLWPRSLLRVGQVVVCQRSRGIYYIKRLVGLGGDRVAIPAQELPHHPLPGSAMPARDTAGNFIWQVPSGHCFVRGDAAMSADSTTWGPIPLGELVGIVLFKLPRRDAKASLSPSTLDETSSLRKLS